MRELVIILISTIAVTGAGYFLLRHFLENFERIKLIQTGRITLAHNDLTRDIRDLHTLLTTYHEQMIKMHGHLKTIAANEEQHYRSLEVMRLYLQEKIGSVEATLADGEIVRTGGNRFMFRGTKGKT